MQNLFCSSLFYLLLQVSTCRLKLFFLLEVHRFVAWHVYFSRIPIIPVRCHLFTFELQLRFVCVPLLGSITTIPRRFPRHISHDLTFPLIRQGFNFFLQCFVLITLVNTGIKYFILVLTFWKRKAYQKLTVSLLSAQIYEQLPCVKVLLKERVRLLLAQVSLTLEEEEVFADIINYTKK